MEDWTAFCAVTHLVLSEGISQTRHRVVGARKCCNGWPQQAGSGANLGCGSGLEAEGAAQARCRQHLPPVKGAADAGRTGGPSPPAASVVLVRSTVYTAADRRCVSEVRLDTCDIKSGPGAQAGHVFGAQHPPRKGPPTKSRIRSFRMARDAQSSSGENKQQHRCGEGQQDTTEQGSDHTYRGVMRPAHRQSCATCRLPRCRRCAPPPASQWTPARVQRSNAPRARATTAGQQQAP